MVATLQQHIVIFTNINTCTTKQNSYLFYVVTQHLKKTTISILISGISWVGFLQGLATAIQFSKHTNLDGLQEQFKSMN